MKNPGSYSNFCLPCSNDPQPQTTSFYIFRKYFQVRPDGSLDASKLISEECYLDWLQTRSHGQPSYSARNFQRTISGHLTGQDGRMPFSEAEEIAVLHEVRQKRIWPCFQNLAKSQQLGKMGFRTLAYHERVRAGVDRNPLFFQSFSSEQMIQLVSKSEDVFKTLFDMVRYLVYAKTSALLSAPERTPEMAENLLKRVKIELGDHEHVVVLVVDPTAKEYSNRVVAQDEFSAEMLGNLIGNAPNSEFSETEFLAQAKVFGTSLFSPGQVFGVPLHLVLKSGEQHLFRVEMFTDPESYLVVYICKHIDEPE